MGVPADEVRLNEDAAKDFDRLLEDPRPEAASVLRRLRDLKPILLRDAVHGEVVRGKFVPAAFRLAYGLENLFVEDLPGFWRLLYTIVRFDGRKVVVILRIVDHATYDKWFPGRKRR
ncbi:MAG: hypothetical protein KGJ23_08875 [Euryarchaeota archaeon]|nr:hypothetical protein [Euryarchaeota archaeon]MDE1836717.1 hypothetical protein [Euryarchaeota archaeon]MDE1881746.1 hypothetical protein [Euryarchaeota archaeon]MDE2044701.1 hypothetical protein [Thermoplasmata archaeon]